MKKLLILAVLSCVSILNAQTCNVSSQTGTDIGAKAAACIATLTSGGTVNIDQGGNWSTQVTVPSGVHVVYKAEAANIVNEMGSRTPIALVNSNSDFVCESKTNTIGAPSSGDETIICGVDQGPGCTNTSKLISNVRVNGCHFVSQGSAGSPLSGSVWLENCVSCETNDNFFDGIQSIEILIGASSYYRAHSQHYRVERNEFTGHRNAAVAVINASDFVIKDNFFHMHGDGASGDIDIEPNAATDWAENGEIAGNKVDATDNVLPFRDYGITLQCAGYVHCQFIKIHDNLLFGGEVGTNTGKLNQGIGTEGHRIEVYNNTIVDPNSAALDIGSDYSRVYGNHVYCQGIIVAGVSPSFPAVFDLVEHNDVSQDGCKLPAAAVTAYDTIRELYNAAGNNTYRANYGVTGYTLLPNDGSVVIP